MPAMDWSLTVFTLTTQMVLGAFAVLLFTDLLARQLANAGEQEYLTRVGVWTLGPLMALGFTVSLLHLGQPLYAFRALSNLQTSWLSREIFFLSAFFGLGAIYAALWWRWPQHFAVRSAYGAIVAGAGALGLFSMIALYMIPAMPTWERVSTPLSFTASALILGPLLVAVVFLLTYRRHDDAAALEPLLSMHLRSMAGTVIVGAVLASIALALVITTATGPQGEASLALLLDEHAALLAGRIGLLVLGVALAAAVLWRSLRASSLRGMRPLVWVLFGVFAGSELLGRLLFYATAVPVRPPGPPF
jgi:anaerobic dimethyl sulfoxide reductase subunit C